MAENNLGSLHYSLNIDLDPRTLAKIQDELDKIETIKRFGSGGGNTSGGGGSSTPKENDGLEKQKQLYEEINKLIQQSTGASSEKAEQIVREQMALAELKNQRELLNQAEKAGAVSTEQSIKLRGEIAEKENQHRIALNELNFEIRNEIKTNNAASGSMDELSQKLIEMKLRFKGMAEEVRNSSVGQALMKDIQQADAKIKILDASIGNYQRNVGDYASGMYGLTYSIQQVARELPNIAISPQMFIMAISNNLPILQDELRRASKAYKELIEQHKIGLNLNQKAIPVGKQIVKSIFSWQSALVALITVATIGIDKIFDFIGETWNAVKGVDASKISHDALTGSIKKGNKAAQEEITQLKLLYLAATDKSRSDRDRAASADEILKKYPDLLKNYTQEQILTDKAAEAHKRLREEILNAAQSKAAFETITENYRKIAEQQEKINKGGTFTGKAIRTMPGLGGFVGDIISAQKTIDGLTDANEKLFESFKQTENDPYGIKAASREFEIYSKLQSTETKNVFDQRSSFISKDTKTYEAWLKKQINEYKDNVDAKIELEKELSTIQNKIKKQPSEKFVDTEKQSRDRQREARDIEYAISQAGIDAMEEGSKKKLAQMELNHKREMDMLNREREDQIQKIVDNARAVFNADPKNKGKKFNSTGTGLSGEEESGFNLQRTATLEKQKAETVKFYDDLLKKYQNYANAVKEINKKYGEERDILKANKASNEVLAEIDRQENEAIKKISEEYAMRSDSYKEWLDGIANMALESILDELAAAQKALSLSEISAGNKKTALAGGLVKGSKETSYDSEQNTQTQAELRAKIEELKKKVQDLTIQRNKKESKNTKNAVEDWKELQTALNEINQEFNEIGDSIGGAVGEIISKAGEFSTSVIKMIEGITALTDGSILAMEGTSKAATNAIRMVETASVILAIIAAAMQITMAIVNALSGKSKAEKDTERLQAISENISDINEAINKQLEKRIDLIEEATAAEAKYLDTITQDQVETQKNYIIKQLGLLSGTEILGLKGKNNDLDLNELMEMMGLSTYKEFIDWWNGGGYRELLAEGYTITNKDSWDEIIDSWNNLTDAAKDSAEAMQESITGISFDSLKDSLDDLITDVDTTFSDIADSFEDHMSQAVLNFIKKTYLNDQLKLWYAQFEEYMSNQGKDENPLTIQEADALRKAYQEAYNEAQKRYDAAASVIGIDKKESESALSQAIKGIQESNPGLIEAYLNTIREMVIAQKIGGENLLSVAQASQHIQSQALSELQAINSNTLAMVNAFKSVMATSKSDIGGYSLRVTAI
ncbi:MAG: hypothetical protein ABFC84_13380 [Veillonellales bacterium]